MSLTLEQFGIHLLSPEQKLELVNLIHASLETTLPDSPEWHLRLLDQRIAAADVDPGTGELWESVYARLSGGR